MQDSFKETFNLSQQKKVDSQLLKQKYKKFEQEALMAKNEVNTNDEMLDDIKANGQQLT